VPSRGTPPLLFSGVWQECVRIANVTVTESLLNNFARISGGT
jgi:hypothetical protein